MERYAWKAVLLEGKKEGTLFVAHKDEGFDLPAFVDNLHKN